MKRLSILLLGVQAAIGQTGTGSIQGTVLDARTQRSVPAAWVIANRAGAPPFSQNTKSGADGAFLIQGLTAGAYALCVQVEGDQYLNPCQWNGNPTTLALTSGQAAFGISLRLTPASVLTIQVHDPQRFLHQNTRDGRRPDLMISVWGPRGVYYPAHGSARPGTLTGGITSYSYRLAVPRDTALDFQIASRDVKLGDSLGVALPANASRQPFLHATGEANPRSFAFTVLGFLP
jgi:hypothetical protein